MRELVWATARGAMSTATQLVLSRMGLAVAPAPEVVANVALSNESMLEQMRRSMAAG